MALAMFRFVLIVSLLLFIPACDWLDDEINWTQMESELEENRAKWNSHGLSDYQYIFEYECCNQTSTYPEIPTIIVVNNNVAKTATFLWQYKENETYSVDELKESAWHEYPTINELFDFAHEAICGERYKDIRGADWYGDRPDEFWIEYNPEYGYPTDVWIDYALKGDDDEDAFSAYGLVPLEALSTGDQ